MRFFVLIALSIICYLPSFFSQSFASSNDTLKLIELNDISYELMFVDPDSALSLAEEYIKISKSLNDYELSKGLKLKGNISQHIGNSKVALDCYYEILNINDFKNDSSLIASTYRDIASVHIYMQDIEKAKILYKKSITIFENLKEISDLATTLNNYGTALIASKEYQEGLEVLNEALMLKKQLLNEENNEASIKEHKTGIAILESNLGLIYMKKGDYNNAIKNLYDAAKIYENFNQLYYQGMSYFYLGQIYLDKNDLFMGSQYAIKLEGVAERTDIMQLNRMSSDLLFQVNEQTGNFGNALEYLEKLNASNDSFFRAENKRALEESEIKYEYEKQAKADSVFYAEEQKIADAKLAVVDAELRSHNRVTNGIILILFLIVVFAIIIWLRFQKNQQEKDIIQSQKKMMDNAYRDLETKKVEIEKKNKEIIDSLHYARYIQRALQPDQEEIASFFGNHAIYNLPKDIVGGDFYWFKTFGDLAIAIAADCTGHGVPGGFLTVLGNLIIETIATNKTISPNEILSKINQELVLILNQKENNSIQDGMDLAICVINKKSKKVVFSGARNGVYIVSSAGNLKEYKGDYTPVGGSYFKKEKLEQRIYTTHEFSLKKGDWVFMYTDGYYDQFGGIKNKSMGVNNFKNILCNSVKQNLDLYSELKKEFLNWKGNNFQLDDVLVFGFTI